MTPSPVRTYLELYAYVGRLALKAVFHRALYLLVAPLVAVIWDYVANIIMALVFRIPMDSAMATTTGFAAGFVLGLIRAAAISLVLFVARAIIEQRKLGAEDLHTGLVAFLGDLLTVLFTFWIVSMILPFPALFALVVLATPLLETTALSSAGGFGIFVATWQFMLRDAVPWIAGQLPLIVLLALWQGCEQFLIPLIPWHLAAVLAGTTLFWALALVAFVYRGILYLTLDNFSPRRRAERFGGAEAVR